MGRPSPVRLVEMGPGDGRLIPDIPARRAACCPSSWRAADLWLVEVSPPRCARPRPSAERRPADAPLGRTAGGRAGRRAAAAGRQRGAGLPARPPVRADGRRLAERMVGLDEAGNLAFGLKLLTLPSWGGASKGRWGEPAESANFPRRSSIDTSPTGGGPGTRSRRRILARPGRPRPRDRPPRGPRRRGRPADRLRPRRAPGAGDTLQALKAHPKVPPLAEPGQADLTVWADFPPCWPPPPRRGGDRPHPDPGRVPARPGIEARAEALAAAQPLERQADQAEKLARQLDRLTGPAQMGHLFKVVSPVRARPCPSLFEDA